MNTSPPLLQPPIPAEGGGRKAGLGRTGLMLSLVAPFVILLMMLIQPGWGSPITVLGGLCALLMPPLALVLSVIGWVRGPDRVAAAVGTLLSAACLLLILGYPLMMALCQ